MGHLAEEAQHASSGRLPDRYHLWYALCVDRSGLGTALQEAHPSVRRIKNRPLGRFFASVFARYGKNEFISQKPVWCLIKIFFRFWKKCIDKAREMVYNDAIR
jgi:hypothetical protein